MNFPQAQFLDNSRQGDGIFFRHTQNILSKSTPSPKSEGFRQNTWQVLLYTIPRKKERAGFLPPPRKKFFQI